MLKVKHKRKNIKLMTYGQNQKKNLNSTNKKDSKDFTSNHRY